MDFCKIVNETVGKREPIVIFEPDFNVERSEDLMIAGGKFKAVWDEEIGLWSTDEYDVRRLVDKAICEEAQKCTSEYKMKLMKNFKTGSWDMYKKFVSKSPDNYHQLDTKITFQNTIVKKEDYISKRLPYELKEGNYSNYDYLISTLYDPEEREKIEWSIGAIISGDARTIQKFMVFYGDAGAGKSTVLNIIQKLFKGYDVAFEAKDLTSANNGFATAVFSKDPLVGINHDGDLSTIRDNTILNSIVSHEEIMVNQKFVAAYPTKCICFLYMATNKPVKITDAKSGLIRRLIDVKPSGRKLSPEKYNKVYSAVDFELGAIAYHCLQVYEHLGKNYYNSYKPLDMMFKTDPFFNFVEDNYMRFSKDDGISLKTAYARYKEYCSESGDQEQMQRYKFREELKNYFRVFEVDKRMEDGTHIRSYYSGFMKEKFEKEKPQTVVVDKKDWLDLYEHESIFDKLAAEWPAQYAVNRDGNEVPNYKWTNVRTCLSDLDTSKLHYVLFPEEQVNHIVVDFDLKDGEGKKSFKKNKEAASKWPMTYAECSKSGNGIHLHYIYQGDATQLSAIYDTDIEIKVYSGNTSLRRMLTKCNDIPLANISSGLPLIKGGKKMVSEHVIKDEKHLINKILMALQKKTNLASTKSNMDYIKDVLDQAYESGMKYDVSLLRNDILEFALSSTNRKEYCYSLIGEMKFCSEEPPNNVDADYDTIVFYDVEVFPNLTLINWKKIGPGNPIVRMINPKPEEVNELRKHKLVGFNCRRYDNHILHALTLGYSCEEVYRVSQGIINNMPDAYFKSAWNYSFTDIYDYCSKKQSLKKWEIELGIHHQELGLAWDKPVPKNMWHLVAEYCDNDVIATEAVWNATQADFIAREMLAALANGCANDTTNTLTTKIIFGDNKNPELVYTDLATGKTSDPEYQRKDILTAFPGYEYVNGHNMYRGEDISKGGYVYSNPGMYSRTITFDVASMHPSSVKAMNCFGKYTKNFVDLLDARIAIKHKDFDKVKEMFDGKLAPYLTDDKVAKALSYALKIAINSVYGLTSASFSNPFKDPRNVNNIVALRGALFMVNLRDEVQKLGGIVVHIKTDSIKIENPTQQIIDFVFEYGKKYGYNFEIEHIFEKLCLVNKAVYIGKLAKDDPEHPGYWEATGTQFAVPYVYKTLFSKEDIVFEDMCETKSVKNAIYLDLNEDLADVSVLEKELEKLEKKKDPANDIRIAELKEDISKGHNYVFVGKVGQFTPMKNGAGAGDLVCSSDEIKYTSVTGTKGYRWLESETVRNRNLNNLIDKSYYTELVDEAIKTISEFGDFSKFVSNDDNDEEIPFV